MTTEDAMLGRCPACSERVGWSDLLMEYKGPSGDHTVFAECGTCGHIVNPE